MVQLGAVAAAIVIILILIVFLIHAIRTRDPPQWLPNALKSRWNKHQIGKKSKYRRADSGQGQNDDGFRPPSGRPSGAQILAARSSAARDQTRIDRHTSVRSIMTLPEYRAVPKQGFETTIAREGERDGMDVVVNFPETETEMEERREEHMDALYRVRRARAALLDRQRNGGNSSTTEDAAVPPAAFLDTNVLPTASAANLAAMLRERNRRISSVAYADLGHARHDGSRISISSDREGLLSSAASIGGTSFSYHTRSGSSMSVATTVLPHSLTPTPERRNSEEFFAPPRLNLEIPNAEGSPVINRPSMDLGEQPPNYDGQAWNPLSPPPQYESPVTRRNPDIEIPELRVIASTPSIAPNSAGAAPSPMTPLAPSAGQRRSSRLSMQIRLGDMR